MKKLAVVLALMAPLGACSSPPPKVASQPQGMELSSTVSQLADRLFQTKLAGDTGMKPIAVASFVNLSSLESSNWLGQQLAEDFIHELHRRGELVLDYKITGSIKVTPEGDFVFSRDWMELAKRVPLSRVLTGTMAPNGSGIVINARIVNLKTHMVEATAQGIVPRSQLSGGLDAGRAVTVTKGMLVRGDYPAGRYGNSVQLTH